MNKNFCIIIAANSEGKICFDDLIIKHTQTMEEAQTFVLDTINPMIDGSYTSTDELSNALISLEEEKGWAPLFDIRGIEA